MKIKAEQDLSCNDIEITIKYRQKDKQVNRIIDFLQSFDVQINGLCHIYYFSYFKLIMYETGGTGN